MIDKSQIEKVLRINGEGLDSDADVIRSVLLSARYNKDEVDTAVMVLKENTFTKQTSVQGLHKVFRTDEVLAPDEISQLLGIQVDVERLRSRERRAGRVGGPPGFLIWILSVFIATTGILFYMYLYKIGLFHPSVGMGL